MEALSAVLPVVVIALLMADIVMRHAVATLASVDWRILVVVSFGVAGDDVPCMEETG